MKKVVAALLAILALGPAALRPALAAYLDPPPFGNTPVSGDCTQVASDGKRLDDSGSTNCGGGGVPLPATTR